MTCGWRTRSPETAEGNTFRPDFRRIERREVRLFDDELERFEQPVTSFVFLDLCDVDAHRNDVGLDLFGRDAEVDASDVTVDSKWSAAPRHGAAARLHADHSVSVFVMIHSDPIFSRFSDVFLVFVRGSIHCRQGNL